MEEEKKKKFRCPKCRAEYDCSYNVIFRKCEVCGIKMEEVDG